ncbi:hypothetical protein V1517DRAFT_59900 [Lipomyces orientalis]|uniref:Uncharacterized protein n=1 Tax=Lipomyces orientalis TaxID=1233043 RepID=A0ACC3TT05_9ASCO
MANVNFLQCQVYVIKALLFSYRRYQVFLLSIPFPVCYIAIDLHLYRLDSRFDLADFFDSRSLCVPFHQACHSFVSCLFRLDVLRAELLHLYIWRAGSVGRKVLCSAVIHLCFISMNLMMTYLSTSYILM